jgi:hypothetical protein
MSSLQRLVSRRTFLAATSLSVIGSAVTLRGASAHVPEANAQTQPSSINVVLYDDKTDVDMPRFLQRNFEYPFTIKSECKRGFHAFHIVNAKKERLLTIPNVGPGQTVPLKWTFLKAGDYTLVNEHLAGYLLPGSQTETKLSVEESTAETSTF